MATFAPMMASQARQRAYTLDGKNTFCGVCAFCRSKKRKVKKGEIMKKAKFETYVKNGKAWELCRTETNETEVYKRLSADLIAKKICKAAYIKSIARRQNYDGTITMTVLYDNGVKNVFRVADR